MQFFPLTSWASDQTHTHTLGVSTSCLLWARHHPFIQFSFYFHSVYLPEKEPCIMPAEQRRAGGGQDRRRAGQWLWQTSACTRGKQQHVTELPAAVSGLRNSEKSQIQSQHLMVKEAGFFFFFITNWYFNPRRRSAVISLVHFPKKRAIFLQLLMHSTSPAMCMTSLTALTLYFSRTMYRSLWRDQQLGNILDIQIPNDPRVVFPNLLAVPNFMPKVAGICLTFWTFVIDILI